jgi:hypothetical protein
MMGTSLSGAVAVPRKHGHDSQSMTTPTRLLNTGKLSIVIDRSAGPTILPTHWDTPPCVE